MKVEVRTPAEIERDAKKEVFDDIETQLYFRDMSVINKKILYRLKKKHLKNQKQTEEDKEE